MNQNEVICTLADIPHSYAARKPEDIALQFETRSTTWQQWDHQCNRVAHALREMGLVPTDRVGYLGKNSDQLFHVFFGAAKAGMVMVPINWRLTATEIAFILEDAGCQILFLGEDFLPLVEELTQACPQLREVLCVDGAAQDLAGLDDWLRGRPETEPLHSCAPEDVVLQLYTSGTTGQPKGAQLTNRNLLAAASLAATEPLGRWREDEVSVLPLPLFHAGGLVYGLNGPLTGGLTRIVREPSPALIIAAMRQQPTPVTRLGLVPAVIQTLLGYPEFNAADFRGLRTLTYGGSPISPAVLRKATEAFGPILVQLFGMTETCTMGTALLPSDHDPSRPERLSSCGRPLPGFEIRIAGAEGGEQAAPGQSGEILIRGDAVMAGYWHRPEATEQALQDGWYHSGDVGYFDADGYLHIQDRLKDMIVSGGENVYPAEVERVLADHPAVADVAVFGVPDATWGEAVKAAVVLRADRSVSGEELITFARSRLAGYKCPKTIDWMTALPRNATGKLLKRVLRQPYWESQTRNVS
ncbi:MAG: long-chain-fatty-acid--CoA ligase [Hydrogenophaga sp.]|uniref:long-chain-fatty-acid--CoA ligase n=1 Tax=Ottowia sp. TaxID=1898956 RepID=UPI00262A99E9|nr:long-chain-fatty-acid--CoA ligase [Ottowia sp.]